METLLIVKQHSLYPTLELLQRCVDAAIHDFDIHKLGEWQRTAALMRLPGDAIIAGWGAHGGVVVASLGDKLGVEWHAARTEARALRQAGRERKEAAVKHEFYGLQARARLRA